MTLEKLPCQEMPFVAQTDLQLRKYDANQISHYTSFCIVLRAIESMEPMHPSQCFEMSRRVKI